MSENKAAQKKAGTWYKPGAEPRVNKGSMPKNFNTKGSSWPVKTPGYSSTKLAKSRLPKNFNITGSSKAGKFAKVSKKPTSTLSKVTKAFKSTPKQLAKPGMKILGKAAKFAAKRLGPVGAAITAYEVVKTIPKVSKATVKGLKKRAKSGNVNIGRKL